MPHAQSISPLLLILALFCLLPPTSPHHSTPCSGHPVPPASGDQTRTICKKLTTLDTEFGWRKHAPTHDSHNSTRVDIYFGARLETGWMAWGINPGPKPKMVGTRAIIGIRYRNGSSHVNTYNITSNTRLGCPLLPSDIDVTVQNMSSEYAADSGYFKMYATMFLDNDSSYNVSRLNHVWQVGLDFVESMPLMHDTRLQNCDSTETINLNTGRSFNIGLHRMHLRTVHGILNMVGWGTLLPIGVIVARYCRSYPMKHWFWFRFHIFCQSAGYILGTAGWGIGMWLGQASKGYTFPIHRILAIFIFTFTTLQMLALRMRPKSSDEYRCYWNMYHHFLGYALLVLIFVNIFRGISILRPHHMVWEWAYIVLLGVLGFIVVVLELYTWTKFWKEKRNKKKKDKDKKNTPELQKTDEVKHSKPSASGETSTGPGFTRDAAGDARKTGIGANP